MTQTPPETPQRPSGPGPSGRRPAGPRVSGEQMRDLSRLRRSTTDRKVAGVAGGLGRHLDVDPTILRVLFVVLAFFGGAGLLLYAAGWLFLPEEGSDQAPIHTSPGTRTVVLVAAAVAAFGLLVGRSWGGVGFPWPLIVIGAIAFLVLRQRGDARTDGASPPSSGSGNRKVYGPEGGSHSTASQGPAAPTSPSTSPAWGQAMPPTASPAGSGYRDIAETRATATAPARTRKRRGPLLFLPTLLLMGIGIGAVALYETFVGDVNDVFYPAVALAVVGLMLVVGAFVGRTGGLIALGLVSALVVGLVAVTGGRWATTRIETPAAAHDVKPAYELGIADFRLDLTDIRNPAELDGRTVSVDVRAGRVQVVVPEDLTVHVDAHITGPGQVDVAGHVVGGGGDVNQSRVLNAVPGAPELTLDLHNRMGGTIEVDRR